MLVTFVVSVVTGTLAKATGFLAWIIGTVVTFTSADVLLVVIVILVVLVLTIPIIYASVGETTAATIRNLN